MHDEEYLYGEDNNNIKTKTLQIKFCIPAIGRHCSASAGLDLPPGNSMG